MGDSTLTWQSQDNDEYRGETMALTISTDQVGRDHKELLEYGTEDFPAAFFEDDLRVVPVPWHWHEEFELVHILEGDVEVSIAGTNFCLHSGDGYFANSGILHEAKLLSEEGRQHCIVFHQKILGSPREACWKRYVSPVLLNHGLPFVRLDHSVSWQAQLLQAMEQAWEAGAREEGFYELTVRERLAYTFALLTSHLEECSLEGQSEKSLREEERVKNALSFLQENYGEALTIEQIAGSAGISVSEALRCFKHMLHTTPIQYLKEYRLERAAQLLLETKEPIADVAAECGFNDMSYFARAFRGKYKMNPREYRENHSIKSK